MDWTKHRQLGHEIKMMSAGIVVVIFTLSMFLNVATVRGENNENYYTVTIRDYDSNEVLTLNGSPRTAQISLTPDNYYVTMFGLELDENNPYYVNPQSIITLMTENAQMANIWIDTDDRRLYLEVSGQSGKRGRFGLTVNEYLIPQGGMQVSLDNQPIEFTIENLLDVGWYGIRAEFTLSTHMLMVDFGPKTIPNGQQPWSIIVVGGVIAAVTVLGAVYWLKFRR
jgi:hypothetical protein